MTDDFIQVGVAGDLSLASVESAIAGEEALGTRFQSCQVVTEGMLQVNRVTFERLFAPPLPKPPRLVQQGSVPPGGTTLQWQGEMQVGGGKCKVGLYR